MKTLAICSIVLGIFFTFYHFGYVAGSEKWGNGADISLVRLFISFLPVFVGLFLLKNQYPS